MNTWLYKTTLILAAILCFSCEKSGNDSLDPASIPFVVEGWIEQGQSPVVMVTHAVDLTSDKPSFDNFIEKWCKVSIWDNGTQHLLTARIDNSYTPSLIFTSSRLKGEIGHTYKLTVECYDRTLSSVTTMSSAPRFEKLVAEKVAGNDSLYSIKAYVEPGTNGERFKFFIKVLGSDGRYYPSFLATLTANDYDPACGVTITKAKRLDLKEESEEFTHYFKSGDLVIVHVCSLQSEIFDFWQSYDNATSLSDNLFFTFDENLPSNIEGGLGYFAAYGMDEALIRIP